MTSPDRPRLSYYLIHDETGQRYPVADGEIVIGRSSGDILFPADEFLAPAQRRLMVYPGGLRVQNLGPMGPVAVNDVLLEKNQTLDFGVEDRLRIGEQTFALHEVAPARTDKPPSAGSRARSRRSSSFTPAYFVVVALVAAAGAAFWWLGYGRLAKVRPRVDAQAISLLDAKREFEDLLERYRLKAAAYGERTDDPASFKELRDVLLPRLLDARAKWAAVPVDSPLQREYVDLKRQFIERFIVFTQTSLKLAGNHGPEVERALDEVSAEMDELRKRERALIDKTIGKK